MSDPFIFLESLKVPPFVAVPSYFILLFKVRPGIGLIDVQVKNESLFIAEVSTCKLQGPLVSSRTGSRNDRGIRNDIGYVIDGI